MRAVFVFLLIFFTAFAAFGAPVVQSVAPNTGFSFGDTRVSVLGSGFSSSDTTIYCNTPGNVCPIRVWFGDVTASVISFTPNQIDVFAPGQNLANVDVRVEFVNGGGEFTLANGFNYKVDANPGPMNYTRYLVPVSGYPVAGAHGSLWEADLVLFNDSDVMMFPIGQFCDPIILSPCFTPALQPKQTQIATLWPYPSENPAAGSFLHIPTPLAASTSKRVRAYDISRSTKSLGVEIPIVTMDEFSPRIVLTTVPVAENYRASLRIYGATEAPEQVVVRVVAELGSEVLDERTVDLAGLVTTEPALFPATPAYARIDPLNDAIRALGNAVRVEVQSVATFPNEYPNPIWAFITITNNETQEVTVISPQR